MLQNYKCHYLVVFFTCEFGTKERTNEELNLKQLAKFKMLIKFQLNN